MSAPAPSPSTPGDLGPLDNPLAGWGNDDLLLTPEARRHFADRHPELLPIFHWPKLATRFEDYDPGANAFRKRSRRAGMWAAGFGFVSLALAALTPVLAGGPGAMRLLGLLAASLAVASGAIGYWSVRKGHSKWRWLANRFWTERMRQLHFQFIANHLALAARAMTDPAALAEWERLRDHTFADFEHRLGRSLRDAIQRMREDRAEDQIWLDESWIRPPPEVASSPELDRIFALLKQQRFGIQTLYPRLKLMPGIASPRSRLRFVRTTAEVLTVAALLLAAGVGLLLAFQESDAFLARLLVGIGGTMTAGVLTLRMIDEGHQLKSETERYEWYLAAVSSLEKQFDSADPAGKAAALREMERISYQELRWFIDSFCAARFVM